MSILSDWWLFTACGIAANHKQANVVNDEDRSVADKIRAVLIMFQTCSRKDIFRGDFNLLRFRVCARTPILDIEAPFTLSHGEVNSGRAVLMS